MIYLSFTGAGEDTAFKHGRAHGTTERMLAESGLSWAALRNGMYADEIPSWFDDEGRITGPGGRREGQLLVPARAGRGACDPARSTTATTTAHRHRHGSESVTLAEFARIATDVTGDDYRYEPQDAEDWVAYRRSLGRAMVDRGGALLLRRRPRGRVRRRRRRLPTS